MFYITFSKRKPQNARFTCKNHTFLCFPLVGPHVSLSSKRLLAEEKQNVSIACNATGRPSPLITWSKLVGSLAGDGIKAQDGTLKIYNVTRKEGGIYICKAESILGSATDTVQLMFFSSLRFTVRPPQEVTPFIGSTLRLSCSAESDLSPTTYWRKEGKLYAFVGLQCSFEWNTGSSDHQENSRRILYL